ncbi:N-acetylneuraminate synthase [Selenomonas sp. WCT3]|uniref:N-acetylneuraminate synthase family protein n=1 Tax=Selenomonas sp. WCT3 TaxID=3158785 RepID=UPI00088B1F1B|nr:N-acetylneuraminate synthase [Selenomonas ruminantium]
MAECRFLDGTVISDYGRPYIVAEVNSSHRGDINVAREMIDKAVEIGCNCVKFQSWTTKSLYSRTYYESNPIAERFVKKFSLNELAIKELSKYCKKTGIAFSSTPYSEDEVDFLVDECNVPFVKIASMEINNLSFLKYIGNKHVPVVLSTGMATTDEIIEAVGVLKKAGVNQMVILHCVSIYPTILDNVNLNNIIGLRELFHDFPIGFSDHTEGDAAAIASVALGAGLIEKHFTLDRKIVGMDNGMATEPDEFSKMVDKCRAIQIAMGDKKRILVAEEIEQRTKMRRSLISIRDIKKGDIIKENDIYAKRPGNGIPPNEIDKIIGRKAKMDIKTDTMITFDQLI